MSIPSLASDARALQQSVESRARSERALLGIAGPPAAGKSRLAECLTAVLNRWEGPDYAVVVPLDGFHFRNAALDARGIRPIKGAPETFDVAAYAAKLEQLRLRSGKPVRSPAFDRIALEEPIEDAILIPDDARLVITEGNYLLLDTPEWMRVRAALDEVWYLTVEMRDAESRLFSRHRKIGNDEATVRRRVYENDLVNFKVVVETAARADRLLGPEDVASREGRH